MNANKCRTLTSQNKLFPSCWDCFIFLSEQTDTRHDMTSHYQNLISNTVQCVSEAFEKENTLSRFGLINIDLETLVALIRH